MADWNRGIIAQWTVHGPLHLSGWCTHDWIPTTRRKESAKELVSIVFRNVYFEKCVQEEGWMLGGGEEEAREMLAGDYDQNVKMKHCFVQWMYINFKNMRTKGIWTWKQTGYSLSAVEKQTAFY